MVRSFDDDVTARLRGRAHRRGPSADEDVCDICRNALGGDNAPKPGLGNRIVARFAGHGVDVDLSDLCGKDPRPAALES
jgi:plasmid stability protein